MTDAVSLTIDGKEVAVPAGTLIIRAAEQHCCDLILMASHGRHGLSALVYGSETRDVLTHSSIPTLVYR